MRRTILVLSVLAVAAAAVAAVLAVSVVIGPGAAQARAFGLQFGRPRISPHESTSETVGGIVRTFGISRRLLAGPPTQAEEIAMLANSMASLEAACLELGRGLQVLAMSANAAREALTPPAAPAGDDALLRCASDTPNGRPPLATLAEG